MCGIAVAVPLRGWLPAAVVPACPVRPRPGPLVAAVCCYTNLIHEHARMQSIHAPRGEHYLGTRVSKTNVELRVTGPVTSYASQIPEIWLGITSRDFA